MDRIEINGKLVVSDPIYTDLVWCTVDLEVLKGEYNCFYEEDDYGCVITSWIVHKNYNVTPDNILEEVPNIVGVDSGAVGYFDYNYFLEKTSQEKDIEDILYQQDEKGRYNSGGVANINAFVTHTQCGDGSYNCYVKRNKNKDIIAVKVNLSSYYEEDLEDYDEEEYED